MSGSFDQEHARMRQDRLRTTVLQVGVALCGLALAVGLSKWLDQRRPAVDPRVEEETLYLKGNTARRMSLGFNGIVADWYWMRSLQYVGRKIINTPDDVPIDDLKDLNLVLLYPLLDNATTLDPQFIEVYQYGGVVLPAVNVDDAIKLLNKGIEKNPQEWRLYHNLGYVYWRLKDFPAAAETYRLGAQQPGAPAWMKAMEGQMHSQGDSRDTARLIYRQMRDETVDPKVREMAELRLLQVDSLDERDAIRAALTQYQQKHNGQCPATWRDALPELRSVRKVGNRPLRLDQSGAPVDPTDVPYLLVQKDCAVDLDWKISKVPYR